MGLCTLPTARTTLTSSSSELDVDHLLSRAILGERPGAAPLSSRAGEGLALPIALEMREIEATCGFGLPAILQWDGTEQVHIVLAAAGHDGLGIHIAPIHHMPGFEGNPVALKRYESGRPCPSPAWSPVLFRYG